jgi:hypothetical protein
VDIRRDQNGCGTDPSRGCHDGGLGPASLRGAGQDPTRVINEVQGVNRVVYDISSKATVPVLGICYGMQGVDNGGPALKGVGRVTVLAQGTLYPSRKLTTAGLPL